MQYKISLFILIIFTMASRAAFAAPGDLDTSFGKFGGAGFHLAFNAEVQGVVVDKANRAIVVACSNLNAEGCVLARFTDAGSLDRTFGKGGTAFLSYGTGGIRLALDRQGRIVAAGNGMVARFFANGLPDKSFGDDGYIYPSDLGMNDFAIDKQGRILVLGTDNGNFILTRYLANGDTDTEFGDDGYVTTDFGGEDFASSLTLNKNKIVLAGMTSSNGGLWDVALARYDFSGNLDTTLDDDGMLINDIRGDDFVQSVQVQTKTGRILVAGHSAFGFSVVSFLNDGTRDMAFGNKGVARAFTNYPSDDVYVSAMRLLLDNKVILTGVVFGAESENLFLVRLLANGKRDQTFADGGQTLVDFADGSMGLSLTDHDGFAYAAGMSVDYGDLSPRYDPFVVKFWL